MSNLRGHFQGSGITTEQQKKTWLINWYFANDPMGSIYLATLRNPAIVASYQTSPGMLYGANGAAGMETYFIKIKTHFGQSMFDQLVTEFAQQSNLYVDEIKVDEWHMYGCSDALHGVDSKRVARDLNLDNQITSNEYVIETPEEVTYLFSSYQLERGAKRYELSNHLGNVLTVISDKKTAVFTGTSFNYFAAEIISATDYSPFGAPLAGRSWNGGEYRFGFNGKENDNEVKGNGNQQDYGMRIHDTRLGRFLSMDPLAISFPWNSVYCFAENAVISCIDLDGKERYLGTMSETSNGLDVSISLINNESVEFQSAAGMAMISWDNGLTFSNDFRIQELQTVFCNSQFGRFGEARLLSSNREPLIPYNGNQTINNQSDNKILDLGRIAPPVYSIGLTLPLDAPKTTISWSNTTGGYNGVDFGAPTGNSESIPYSAGISASASIVFNMGSNSGAQDELWNVSITDKSGNLLWNASNFSTGGLNQTLTLNLPIGANSLNVNVQAANEQTSNNFTGNYSYNVSISTSSASCP